MDNVTGWYLAQQSRPVWASIAAKEFIAVWPRFTISREAPGHGNLPETSPHDTKNTRRLLEDRDACFMACSGFYEQARIVPNQLKTLVKLKGCARGAS
jgi:hypothetical protein